MIRRRTVLASSVAMPVVASAAALGPYPDPIRDEHGLRYVIASGGDAAEVVRSVPATAGGATVLPLARDLTAIYRRLDRELAAGRFAMAGLTSANDFFALERLAWDRGLKTVFRGSSLAQAISAWIFSAPAGFASAPRVPQMPPSTAGRASVAWLLVPR